MRGLRARQLAKLVCNVSFVAWIALSLFDLGYEYGVDDGMLAVKALTR